MRGRWNYQYIATGAFVLNLVGFESPEFWEVARLKTSSYCCTSKSSHKSDCSHYCCRSLISGHLHAFFFLSPEIVD